MKFWMPPVFVMIIFGGLMYALAKFLPVGDFDFFGRRELAYFLFGWVFWSFWCHWSSLVDNTPPRIRFVWKRQIVWSQMAFINTLGTPCIWACCCFYWLSDSCWGMPLTHYWLLVLCIGWTIFRLNRRKRCSWRSLARSIVSIASWPEGGFDGWKSEVSYWVIRLFCYSVFVKRDVGKENIDL